MGKLAYPPCITNPNTERPYKTHKWMIPRKAEVIVRQKGDSEPIYFYRVVCVRCGFNDPNPPTH